MHWILINLLIISSIKAQKLPVVINTWDFRSATQAAWEHLQESKSIIDALEIGCTTCEVLQCDGTVGYGGSPDENGETTLDALIFDGSSMKMGGVAVLRNIKEASSVAKHVLKYTEHSILAGELATKFAVQMGFKERSLTTNSSKTKWLEWKAKNCQPNSWLNVKPDSKTNCGPYAPSRKDYIEEFNLETNEIVLSKSNHDTIGMLVADEKGNLVAGTSTNGKIFKIPGRVSDSPLPGAGAYADNAAGAAAATGDGDIMMRFLPSFLAVELMRKGRNPTSAAREAIARIRKHYPDFFGGVIALNTNGDYGAACNGMDRFPFSVMSSSQKSAQIKYVPCKTNTSLSEE